MIAEESTDWPGITKVPKGWHWLRHEVDDGWMHDTLITLKKISLTGHITRTR
jgi:hypothetical protein